MWKTICLEDYLLTIQSDELKKYKNKEDILIEYYVYKESKNCNYMNQFMIKKVDGIEIYFIFFKRNEKYYLIYQTSDYETKDEIYNGLKPDLNLLYFVRELNGMKLEKELINDEEFNKKLI